jgi:alkylated DNA repair dioxygenase AlkB
VAIEVITQPCLLDLGTASGGVLRFDPQCRISLDDCCWIELQRNWLPAPDVLFEDLVEHLDWHQTERAMFDRWVIDPRLGAMVTRPTTALRSAQRALESHFERSFGAIWCNMYRHGSDSVAWHRDRDGSRPIGEVAIISLGGSRTFRIRAIGGGPGQSIELHSGDLLVMGGKTQAHFEHSIPKRAHAHARISVTLRAASVGSADRRARRRDVRTPDQHDRRTQRFV